MTGADKKVNVAHLIASLQIGGAENQVALLLSHLDSSRFQPHLITFKEVSGGFLKMLPEYVKVHCIQYRRRNAPISLYRLYKILKEQRIDILHCHMYHAGVRGSIVGWLASVSATLVSEHGKNTWKKPIHHLIEKQIVSRLTACRVAVSEDIRQIRIKEDGVPSNSVRIISNSVDTDVPVKDNKGIPRVAVALGRLIEAKDYPVLLHAVKLLHDRGYDISLRIAGEGDQRPKLERLISELGLEKQAMLVGNQNANKFLSEIDLFVMSSMREGVPVALLEAMAHGLPIVATQAGGIPEVIEHGHDGLLCPISDPKCLADKIIAMINSDNMRTEMGGSARNKVVRDFGIESVVHQWETLYESLLYEGVKNE